MFAVIAYMMSTGHQGPLQILGTILFLFAIGAILLTYDACVALIKRLFGKRP